QDYEIPVSKIVKAVTNHGSNLVKAFEEYASDRSEDWVKELNPDEDVCNDYAIFEILESAKPAYEEEFILTDSLSSLFQSHIVITMYSKI
ncbi:unnamed protein product, partial [Allacma fusca]